METTRPPGKCRDRHVARTRARTAAERCRERLKLRAHERAPQAAGWPPATSAATPATRARASPALGARPPAAGTAAVGRVCAREGSGGGHDQARRLEGRARAATPIEHTSARQRRIDCTLHAPVGATRPPRARQQHPGWCSARGARRFRSRRAARRAERPPGHARRASLRQAWCRRSTPQATRRRRRPCREVRSRQSPRTGSRWWTRRRALRRNGRGVGGQGYWLGRQAMRYACGRSSKQAGARRGAATERAGRGLARRHAGTQAHTLTAAATELRDEGTDRLHRGAGSTEQRPAMRGLDVVACDAERW